ncbi:MAG: type II secretion system minor pseudopilin GspI [Burkholderiales bacterium]|nr:type II secretion system minor pseudopilin GspI [Burkholderiales bacterium]
MKMALKRTVGFTLIEVLVALAILGIALAASMRTLNLSIDTARETRERLAATWVLQNRLAEIEARRLFPGPGETSGEVVYAGLRLLWKQRVVDTPNAAFRRVELSAALVNQPDYALARLNGYAVQAP